jgi:DNA-binding MarR family transcriptional regulator
MAPPQAATVAAGPVPAESVPVGTVPAGSVPASTVDLLSALRDLFTCTRKMRSWISDAGPMTVLAVVAEHGETRVSALAAALMMDVSTVSRALTGLCRDGLVQWRPDEKDLRSHLVSATPAGLERLATRRAEVIDQLADRLQDWPESDVVTLRLLLHRFVSRVLCERPAAAPGAIPSEPPLNASPTTSTTSTSSIKESA